MKLKELAEIQAGYQSTRKIRPEKNGTHSLIQAKDIQDQKSIDYSNLIKFRPMRKPKLYLVQKNNILFQGRGFTHHAVHVQECPENVLAASVFYIIRIKHEGINPAYLAWWLNQAPVQHELWEKAGSSYLSFVSIKILESVKIELPAMELQDKITGLMALKDREIRLLDELKKHKEKLINQLCINKISQAGD